MTLFLWNLLLSFFWAAISGELNIRNLLVGFIIGFIILGVTGKALGTQPYMSKTRKLCQLILMILFELMKSSLKITYDILTPTHHMRPGVIKVPLDAKTPAEITLFSNILSLTPGTLSLDVSDDGKFLFVHVMYLQEDDLELIKLNIKRRFESPVLELLR